MTISQRKIERLKPLLAKLYWASTTPREQWLVRVLFAVLGLPDPIFGNRWVDGGGLTRPVITIRKVEHYPSGGQPPTETLT